MDKIIDYYSESKFSKVHFDYPKHFDEYTPRLYTNP